MFSVPVFTAILLASGPGERLVIQTAGDGRRVTVVARLPKLLAESIPPGDVTADVAGKILRFHLMGEDGKPGPAIFGKYRRVGDALTFVPRYGLVHGHRYRATLVLSADQTISKEYRVPRRKPSPPPVVRRIYPSASILPANHLKFYLHFSKPMREGRAIFERIQILDENGKPVADPWRRTELWTRDAKRFTLWIHPGRVKQGVNLRDELGPVLTPGKSYTLVIGAELQDAEGQPLGKPFVKKFKTAAADSYRPLPQDWKLTSPRAGTREPVKLALGEPLDQALLQRCLDVRDAGGKLVAGEVRLQRNESIWTFQPKQPWQARPYSVHIADILEDLAGNTPKRVFDTDLTKPAGVPPRLTLRFQPGD